MKYHVKFFQNGKGAGQGEFVAECIVDKPSMEKALESAKNIAEGMNLIPTVDNYVEE